MDWTLKDLKEFVEKAIAQYNENEIVYLNTDRHFGALHDGEIILESDLED